MLIREQFLLDFDEPEYARNFLYRCLGNGMETDLVKSHRDVVALTDAQAIEHSKDLFMWVLLDEWNPLYSEYGQWVH